MSHRTLIVLGAAILAASTFLFSLWTVQIFVVPTVIVLVLFGMLFLGPTPAAAQDLELPAWLSEARRPDDKEQERHSAA
jgi:fatty acid desaturase